jgi:hypothetical protein
MLSLVSHRDTIKRLGGPAALGRIIEVDSNTVKAWALNDSIPCRYWWIIAVRTPFTLEELAIAKAYAPGKQGTWNTAGK